jgi:simple sugar transport system ATP-binding protein
MEVLKTMMRVRARNDIAIIFVTHHEIYSQLAPTPSPSSLSAR